MKREPKRNFYEAAYGVNDKDRMRLSKTAKGNTPRVRDWPTAKG